MLHRVLLSNRLDDRGSVPGGVLRFDLLFFKYLRWLLLIWLLLPTWQLELLAESMPVWFLLSNCRCGANSMRCGVLWRHGMVDFHLRRVLHEWLLLCCGLHVLDSVLGVPRGVLLQRRFRAAMHRRLLRQRDGFGDGHLQRPLCDRVQVPAWLDVVYGGIQRRRVRCGVVLSCRGIGCNFVPRWHVRFDVSAVDFNLQRLVRRNVLLPSGFDEQHRRRRVQRGVRVPNRHRRAHSMQWGILLCSGRNERDANDCRDVLYWFLLCGGCCSGRLPMSRGDVRQSHRGYDVGVQWCVCGGVLLCGRIHQRDRRTMRRGKILPSGRCRTNRLPAALLWRLGVAEHRDVQRRV